MQLTTPTPVHNESYGQFVTRAHQELLQAIPDHNERNNVVWEAWAAVHGNTEQARADRFFAQDQFTKRPNVVYFAEHETSSKAADGSEIVRRYDVGKLADIVSENNYRIADMDSYPTVIDGHTSPPGTPNAHKPETIGGVGPLRIGMVGRVNPRFAIIGDEYISKDKAPVAASNPGRSVELVTFKSNGRTYINPIAAISEAPRIPLPLQFQEAEGTEVEVERYSCTAQYSMGAPVPVSPGGGNTFTKRFDCGTPDDNPNPNPSPTQESSSMLTDQDIKTLVDAVMSTAPMQWVQDQMQAGGTPAGGEQPGATGMDMGGGGGMPAGAGQQYGAGTMMRYAVGAGGDANGAETDNDDTVLENGDIQISQERYSALMDGQTRIMHDLEAAQNQIAVLAAERADAERRQKLQEIGQRFGVNVEEEMEKCLYSAGAQMTDEQFDDHLDTIERYAAKSVETMSMVPDGELPKTPAGSVETEKYQAQVSQVTMQLHNNAVNEGKIIPYAELRQQAETLIAEHQGAGT